MENAINKYIEDCIDVIPQKEFKCKIRICDGAISGYYAHGQSPQVKVDIAELPFEGRTSQFDLIDQLLLIEGKDGLSPYALDLEFDQSRKFSHQLHYPDLNFGDLSKIDKNLYGDHPNYVFLNLNPYIIGQFDELELSKMVPLHVAEARKVLKFESDIDYTKSVSEEFYLTMINVRAECEINDGQFDLLYDFFSEFPPDVIVDIYRSFALLGDATLTGLIAESLRLYAHFHDNVNAARETLGIEPIEKTHESDIMKRYYALAPSVQQLRAAYIRNNAGKFSKTVVTTS